MEIEPPSLSLINFILTNQDYNILLLSILLLVLLFFSAFISGSEVAFFSLNHSDIEKCRSGKEKNASYILDHLNDLPKLLATILIANNFINVAIVVISSYLSSIFIPDSMVEIFGYTFNSKFLLEISVITSILLVFGEIIPKVYANNKPLDFANFSAKALKFIGKTISPLVHLLLKSTVLIENKLKKKNDLSMDKLSQALELTSNNSDKEEHRLLEGIVNFRETDSKQIMVPRTDVFFLKESYSFAEVLKLIKEKNFSRIPVYKESIDDITGILYAKDLLAYLNKDKLDWTSLLKEAIFIPENKKIKDLLNDFKHQKVHLAVVVDEFGGTSGIISLDDVLGEIVGEISDEFDDNGLEYSKINENIYSFEGKTSLKDFYKILNIEQAEVFEDNKGEADSLAGFVLEITGTFPVLKQKVNFLNYEFEIESLNRKRIKRLKVSIKNA